MEKVLGRKNYNLTADILSENHMTSTGEIVYIIAIMDKVMQLRSSMGDIS